MLNREYFEWFVEDVDIIRKMSKVFDEWNKNKNKSFKDVFLSVNNGNISPSMYDYFIDNSIEILNFMEATMLVGEDFIDNLTVLERYLNEKEKVLSSGDVVPTFNIKLSSATTLLNFMCHNHMLATDISFDREVGNRMIVQKVNLIRDDGNMFAYNMFGLSGGDNLTFEKTIYGSDLDFISRVWFGTIKKDFRGLTFRIKNSSELKAKLDRCKLNRGKEYFYDYCVDNNLDPDKLLTEFVFDHITIDHKVVTRKHFKEMSREERKTCIYLDEHQFSALKNVLLYYYSDYRDVAYKIGTKQNNFFTFDNINSVAPIMKNCKNIAFLIEKAKDYFELLKDNINVNYYDISKMVRDNYGEEYVVYSSKLLSFILTNANLYNNFANVPIFKLDRMRYLMDASATDNKSLNFLNSLNLVRNAIRHGQFYIDFAGDTNYCRWHNGSSLGRYVAGINNNSLLSLMYKLFEFDINNYKAEIDLNDPEVMQKSVLFGMDDPAMIEEYNNRENAFIELTRRRENRGTLRRPASANIGGNGESGGED